MIDGRRMYRGKIKVYQRYGSRKRNSREDRGRERTNLSCRRIDRGGGGGKGERRFLLSAFHQKMALWDAYQVLFFVSFKMNPRILSHRRPRQIHASSIPGTGFPPRRSIPIHREGLRDDRNIIERQQRDAFRGNTMGRRGGGGKKCRETAASP